jgi:hypothetical protein
VHVRTFDVTHLTVHVFDRVFVVSPFLSSLSACELESCEAFLEYELLMFQTPVSMPPSVTYRAGAFEGARESVRIRSKGESAMSKPPVFSGVLSLVDQTSGSVVSPALFSL